VACHRFGKASLLAGTTRAIETIIVESREQARGQKAAASSRTQKLWRMLYPALQVAAFFSSAAFRLHSC